MYLCTVIDFVIPDIILPYSFLPDGGGLFLSGKSSIITTLLNDNARYYIDCKVLYT